MRIGIAHSYENHLAYKYRYRNINLYSHKIKLGAKIMENSDELFNLVDEIGFKKVIHIYEPRTKIKAIVVIDNVAIGPAIGGVRMHPDVTVGEVRRLARTMTYKNAMGDIPHGGGKSGIIADPKTANKEEILRTFAREIRDLKEFIPAPDMGTNETDAAYIYDEIGRAAGLPRDIGGIPIDEIGTTGYGIAECIDVAKDYINLDLNGARITIEGFGSVGKNTAYFLSEKGMKLIAASDSRGTIYNPKGLNVEELIRIKDTTGSVINYKNGKVLEIADLISISTDIIVPSARPDVINEGNFNVLDAKLVVEGANIPITENAEKMLHDRGIIVIPDFIASAGGVIACSVEYHGGTEKQAFNRIKSAISRNTKELLDKVYDEKTYPRETAINLAKQKVLRAMKYRKVEKELLS
jgi:glutamate dehydrogenase (NAD(P)+)